MAKEDFCFTYYDGDAARDKAHMSRLERGAYDDIISAQRKKGRLSIDDIKKVLSRDFESCWPAMEWVLVKDDQDKYFIEWVEMSVEKMRAQSQKQKDKVDKYWAERKKNDTVEEPQNILRNNHSINPEEPLEDGDEYVLETVLDKGGLGGKDKKPTIDFETFYNLYDKKVGDKAKLKTRWFKLTDFDRQKIIDYIPLYKQAQPDKAFRKNPETFLNNRGWEDEIITSKNKSHGAVIPIQSKPGRSERNDLARTNY